MPPPYVTLLACEEIKQSVRNFFAGGHKSANKIYDRFAPVSDDKRNKRAQAAVASSKVVDQFRRLAQKFGASYFKIAQQLIHSSVSERSGNCFEMAILSAYYAWSFYHIDRSRIYIAGVLAPGDHAFCLIAPVQIAPSCLQFGSVTDFVDSGSVVKWAICDPWLNVACGASDYLTNGGQKLDKWAAEGKLIGWNGRWSEADGLYKSEFCKSPVKLKQF